MSHWAKLDANNVVTQVVHCNNDDPRGDEGYSWLVRRLGGTWVKTSYNAATNKFRKQFAGVGMVYDEALDIFRYQQPFPSWTLNQNGDWVAPVPAPTQTLNENEVPEVEPPAYAWDESGLQWVEVTKEIPNE